MKGRKERRIEGQKEKEGRNEGKRRKIKKEGKRKDTKKG
jgi:hypothetical protein